MPGYKNLGHKQATINVDLAMHPSKVAEHAKKHGLEHKIVEHSGPGGGWPNVDLSGPEKAIKKYKKKYEDS